ncbi:hypothetical protein L9F63_023997, partial [Diploptera punctata]
FHRLGTIFMQKLLFNQGRLLSLTANYVNWHDFNLTCFSACATLFPSLLPQLFESMISFPRSRWLDWNCLRP